MNIRKIIIGGGASILIILAGFGIFCYHAITKSFPKTTGTISNVEVSAAVHIYRDTYGVPHIVAETEDDAYFAMGFLHAQERLFQMDMQRRAGAGRLSEIFGTRTIPFDAMFRTVGIEHIAQRMYANMRPEAKRALEDYARGVNAFIDQNRSHMPIEFDMLNYKPYPWTPVHSLIITRMMAWELNMGWWEDVAVQDAIDKTGLDAARELFPQYPADAPVIFNNESVAPLDKLDKNENAAPAKTDTSHKTAVGALPRNAESVNLIRSLARTDEAYHQFLGIVHNQTGSNAWAVSPAKSVSGKPILCNDPHLVITTPSPWYQAHICAGSLNVAGVTIPGDPFIVSGRTATLAWGETNAMLDDCDFIVEQLDSSNSSRYYSHGAAHDMKVVNDTIPVKDTEAVVLKIYSTEHGPIISAFRASNVPERLFDNTVPQSSASALLRRSAVALHWTGSDMSDENYSLWKFNHAKSAKDFLEGVRTWGCPAQDFVYADAAGTIGCALGGNIPLRATPIPGLSVPVSAAHEDQIWTSYLPFDRQPRLQNPRDGYVAAANNKLTAQSDYYFTNTWEPPSRARRIGELLQSRPRLSVADMKVFQNDYISPYAFDMARTILAAFPDSATQQPLVKQALNYFANWNGSMSKEEIAASVFNVWMIKMMELMFKPRLGDTVYKEYLLEQALPQRALSAMMKTPESIWFDDPSTPQREHRDDVIRKALLMALQDLTDRFSSTEMKRWQWGSMHRMIFRHPFGEVKPLDKVFDIGPLAAGGALTTINNAQFSLLHPYDSDLGPSMRIISDLSTMDMLCVITSGESGQAFSPHYDDQTGLWLNSGYISITLDPTQIPQAGWEELVLEK